MWEIILGAAVGIGGTLAIQRRTRQMVEQERRAAARAIENGQTEQARLRKALDDAREQLRRERDYQAMRAVQRDAWETGYAEGLADGADRGAAEQFIALFESGQGAAMMYKRRRSGHAGYSG